MQQRTQPARYSFGRHSPPHILTLVVATAASASALNVILPSLPGLARHFAVPYSVVQLAVSLYLVALAVLQLLIGPLSDRYGRRPVMLVCFAVFICATLAALVAPTIEALLACRTLQAFSAAGMVVSRAVVRDTVGADEAASKLGYITMGMSVAPMLAPIVGGYLDESFGWRSTFWLTVVIGIIAFAAVYFDLGETNHSRSQSLAGQFRTYPELLRSRRFWGYTVTAAFTSGTFFAFLGGGPFVATELLGLSSSAYGLYYAIITTGYILGNFLSGRWARALGINRMMLAGNLLSAAGCAVSAMLFAVGYLHPLSLFGPVFLVGVGNGVTLPSAIAGIVSVRPHLAGSASGLGGSLQLGGGAALSVLAGAVLTTETGALPLVAVMLFSALAAIAATLYTMRIADIAGEL